MSRKARTVATGDRFWSALQQPMKQQQRPPRVRQGARPPRVEKYGITADDALWASMKMAADVRLERENSRGGKGDSFHNPSAGPGQQGERGFYAASAGGRHGTKSAPQSDMRRNPGVRHSR